MTGNFALAVIAGRQIDSRRGRQPIIQSRRGQWPIDSAGYFTALTKCAWRRRAVGKPFDTNQGPKFPCCHNKFANDALTLQIVVSLALIGVCGRNWRFLGNRGAIVARRTCQLDDVKAVGHGSEGYRSRKS
jgi:hypothetical protein